MTKGEDFIRNAKCKHGHRSSMSESAWCDLNNNCTVLKLHDMCHTCKCNCKKQISFSPEQFQLEGNAFENTMKKIFKGSQTAWKKLLKPILKIASPYIGKAVSARTNIPQTGTATSDILKSMSGGKVLSLTEMHGNG